MSRKSLTKVPNIFILMNLRQDKRNHSIFESINCRFNYKMRLHPEV